MAGEILLKRFCQTEKFDSLLAYLLGDMLVQVFQPALGDLLNAVSGAGQHAGQSTYGVGVVALIDRCNQAGFKTVGAEKIM